MSYPYKFTKFADKEALVKEFKGKSKRELPTPCLIVNQNVVQSNCTKMLENARAINASFRAHIKTHKTLECTLLQLGNKETDKIIVSTLMEAWNILPLVEKGLINDILFSLPVIESRLLELYELSSSFSNLQLRLMLDNYEQLQVLANFNKSHNIVDKKWSVFIKINMGTDRAGLTVVDKELDQTVEAILRDPFIKEHVSLFGFYCHAGHAYGSKCQDDAKNHLIDEIKFGNIACKKAIEIDSSLNPIISVGSTPTAHVSHAEVNRNIKKLGKLYGTVELHAGNYTFCDLQQVATNCITMKNVAVKVLADVISKYPNRGSRKPGEELINAGVISLSREVSPIMGYGKVVSPSGYGDWVVGRLSQEHGILVPENENATLFPIGTRVEIVPQHSCITAASQPWYFVFDADKDEVIDVWVPFRGW